MCLRLVIESLLDPSVDCDSHIGWIIQRGSGQWDGPLYNTVAARGYLDHVPTADGTAAFFPLYPLVLRTVSNLTGLSMTASSHLVNNLLALTFVILVWFVTKQLIDSQTADRAALLVSFFPGSYVLSMGYSEALMLSLSAGCLIALHKRWWIWAGMLAALATATRPNAIALVVACAVAAGLALARERPRPWRAVGAPLLAPLGALAYFAYLWRHTGHFDGWFIAEKTWDEHFDFGVNNFVHRLPHGLLHPTDDFNITFVAVGTVAVVALVALLAMWRPPAYITAYTLTIVVLTLGSYSVGARPRFILTAFPLLIALARPLREWSMSIVTAACTVLLTVVCIVTAGTIWLTP